MTKLTDSELGTGRRSYAKKAPLSVAEAYNMIGRHGVFGVFSPGGSGTRPREPLLLQHIPRKMFCPLCMSVRQRCVDAERSANILNGAVPIAGAGVVEHYWQFQGGALLCWNAFGNIESF
jgi:hypothetical protein